MTRPKTNLNNLDVAERYSQFAPVYNQSVESWGYRCYQTAAEIVQQYIPQDQPVLDAGCGTGLVGQALAALGYGDIVGIDISPEMLAQAEALGHYRQVHIQDLKAVPYPFADETFAAIACIGVFSLVADPKPILKEFCRLVRSQGYLVFTQQEVLFAQYHYGDVLAELEQQGVLRCEQISAPEVYLPEREGYGDRTVIFYIYQVLK